MKVLIVHNHYREPGGEDRAVKVEQQLLEAAGHEVVTYFRFNKETDGWPADRKLRYFLSEGRWSRTAYAELADLIRRKRPDVAHFHNSFFLVTPSAYEACFDERVPVVQTLHNYRFLCANGLFYRNGGVCEDCRKRGPYCAALYRCWRGSLAGSLFIAGVNRTFRRRNILGRIRRFIAPSAFTRQKYIEAGFPADRITVIPNGLVRDPGYADPRGEHVLYAGTLREYKGVRDLVQAWREVPDLPLKVVGDGPLRAELRKFIGDNGLNHVELLGALDHGKVLEHIKKALWVVAPSRCYETFGQTALEAFACGVPVMTGRVGAMAELVEDGETGFLFDPRDPAGLPKTIARAREDLPRLKEMRRKARHKFESIHSLRSEICDLLTRAGNHKEA